MAIKWNPSYRNTWMFPRNIRRIYPWKMAQICQVLNQLSLNENEWTQETQNEFSQLLTNGALKSQNSLRDSKSGGARTYSSQLESLGLIYKQGKKIFFTLAGKSLVDFDQPLRVIQTQIINYQYPSSYSAGQNVKINPDIRIKPFVFLLELLKDDEIAYLKQEELVFLIAYGHNSGCFSFVKQKILSFRSQKPENAEIFRLIDNPLSDLYTYKAKNKNNPVSLLKEALEVANTLKNYLLSSCLAFESKSDKKIYLSQEYLDIIDEGISKKDTFIPSVKGDAESFLRAYGAWNKQKDTKTNVERRKLSKGETIISSQYFFYIGSKLVINSAEDFILDMIAKFGFERTLIERIIDPLIPKSLSFFESHYIELSKGGIATASEFEKATAELFTNTFKIKAKHTGNKFKDGVGGYSDILLTNEAIGENGIIDTKASSSYSLPSTDYAKMKSNYIPNFKGVSESENHKLGFVLYVAGGLAGEINSKLVSLFSETGIPASAINSKSLIEIAQQKNVDELNSWAIFKSNKVLSSRDFTFTTLNSN